MSGRKHTNAFKLKVALAAIKEDKTLPELCQEFNLHQSVIHKWKKKLKEHGAIVFEDATHKLQESKQKAEMEQLRAKIGELVMERDYLKNVLDT